MILKTVDDLCGKHKHRPIFILGTSGSLDELNLDLIEGYTTIGTNHILKNDRYIPDYLLMVDRGVLFNQMDQIRKYPQVKLILRDKLVNELKNSKFDGEVYQFNVWPKPNEVMRVHGVVQQVNNTAHYSIEIAHRMLGTVGPARIVLLGVDLFYPPTEGVAESEKKKSHFFGDGTALGCRPNFQRVLAFFPKTVVYLKRRKIELVTCSPWEGPLTKMLIHKSLEEVIAEAKK